MNKIQKKLIARLDAFKNISTFDSEKISVLPGSVVVTDGEIVYASRAVLRDGHDGSNSIMDWKNELYKIDREGNVKKV